MRPYLTFFSLLLMPFLSLAQDDVAAQAAQQSQQAAMQAMQNAAEANRQASEATQQAMQNSQNSPNQPCCIYWTAPPKFSVKSGKFSGPTTVRITDATRGAVIYYSTDGWTPTTNSRRYREPILIDSTTTLQAIAVAPYAMRSMVASAQYTIAGTSGTSPSSGASLQEARNGPANATPVHLVFDADVTSRSASVGNKVPLTLSEDLQLGNVLVKKGAPAAVTITQVDRTGIGGAPGTLSFEVEDLQTESGPIALQGGATREGQAKPPNATVLIPMVGPFALLKHGTDAVIPKGTPFTAFVSTPAPPAAAK